MVSSLLRYAVHNSYCEKINGKWHVASSTTRYDPVSYSEDEWKIQKNQKRKEKESLSSDDTMKSYVEELKKMEDWIFEIYNNVAYDPAEDGFDSRIEALEMAMAWKKYYEMRIGEKMRLMGNQCDYYVMTGGGPDSYGQKKIDIGPTTRRIAYEHAAKLHVNFENWEVYKTPHNTTELICEKRRSDEPKWIIYDEGEVVFLTDDFKEAEQKSISLRLPIYNNHYYVERNGEVNWDKCSFFPYVGN